jgi:signal transduction histidine kinase
LLDPDSHKDALRLMNMMDHRKATLLNQNMKTRLRKKGGIPVYLQLHLTPMTDEQGNVKDYYGLGRDISEQMAYEQRLREEMAKAQEVEQVKAAFLKNMSYEIRTPLNAVVGFAELFNLDHKVEDEPTFVEEIKRNSNYLLMLINNILYLSRLNAHMVEVQTKEVDMAECFTTHTVIGWEGRVQEGVNTEIDLPYEHLVIESDEQLLAHLIENLASSSARYTTVGRIKASLSYFDKKLTITFDDTGRGMDEREKIAAIGDVGNGNDTETELKIAICAQLAELLGGHLAIESELDRGTTVAVTLPAQATTIERKIEA